MTKSQSQHYWNTIGFQKDFEDPLYLDKLAPYLHPDSIILEYGCGYGRMMDLLQSHGYQNLTGYDFAGKMIERGKATYPDLDLRLLEESGQIPLPDHSVDAVIMLTILCCVIDEHEQQTLIDEVRRVLKKGGVLYLSDFLISAHPYYEQKYKDGMASYGRKGVYQTTENLLVRHLSPDAVEGILSGFDLVWYEEFDFKTMNHDPAKTFHCIARIP